MKRTDIAFWLTIIPAVLAWRFARTPLLEILGREYSGSASQGTVGIWNNLLFAAVLALGVGYIGGLIARPQYLRAAGNIAFGLAVCYGIQNYIDYRGLDLSVSYYVAVPVAAVVAAIIGGLICRFQLGWCADRLTNACT